MHIPGPTPGFWSQKLPGLGLGICILNKGSKQTMCSLRTAAQGQVHPASMAWPGHAPRVCCPVSPPGPRLAPVHWLPAPFPSHGPVYPPSCRMTALRHMTAPPSCYTIRGLSSLQRAAQPGVPVCPAGLCPPLLPLSRCPWPHPWRIGPSGLASLVRALPGALDPARGPRPAPLLRISSHPSSQGQALLRVL